MCYAANQCIGEVNPVDQQVHYVTYAEIYGNNNCGRGGSSLFTVGALDHARRLATTLQLLLGTEGVVILRSENKGWWIAADAAITFAGSLFGAFCLILCLICLSLLLGFVNAPVATSVAPQSMRKMIQVFCAIIYIALLRFSYLRC
jgi:hypothetical protein